MRYAAPVLPGRVDWTGDNPGILLREGPEGPFTAMCLSFRVDWSPAGAGRVLLLYGDPDCSGAPEAAGNYLVADNADLGEYLLENFIGGLKAFAEAPAFRALERPLPRAWNTRGDPAGHRFSETVVAGDMVIELVWEGLEPARMLELPPELTGSGRHVMSSILVPARDGVILVNGRRLRGQPGRRVQAGFETSTAFLYFSETWILPDNDS